MRLDPEVFEIAAEAMLLCGGAMSTEYSIERSLVRPDDRETYVKEPGARDDCASTYGGDSQMKLYERISTALCEQNLDEVKCLVNLLPHGWSIDSVVKLNINKSTPDRLVFSVNYHHMNDGEGYDFWTGHRMIVTIFPPVGFHLYIKGTNMYHIREYLRDAFSAALNGEI
jgi:hypothetical protein